MKFLITVELIQGRASRSSIIKTTLIKLLPYAYLTWRSSLTAVSISDSLPKTFSRARHPKMAATGLIPPARNMKIPRFGAYIILDKSRATVNCRGARTSLKIFNGGRNYGRGKRAKLLRNASSSSSLPIKNREPERRTGRKNDGERTSLGFFFSVFREVRW